MKTTLPRSLQHGRVFVQPEVIITGLPGIWNKNQTLSKMCHVCVYNSVIIKKWTTFNKGEMAFLKFFCLFKQLKTQDSVHHPVQWVGLSFASLQLVLILQIHKKRRQMHFVRVKRERGGWWEWAQLKFERHPSVHQLYICVSEQTMLEVSYETSC